MMLRRCLVFAALLFWHGGATFYASVVIPVGLHTLQPPGLQTFVTRTVTLVLNLTGAVALVLFAWDIRATPDPRFGRRLARWLACVGMFLTLGVLVWLHTRLDRLMDVQKLQILDHETLRPLHRLYVAISGLQWTCGTVYAFLTLCAWIEEASQSDSEHERLSGSM